MICKETTIFNVQIVGYHFYRKKWPPGFTHGPFAVLFCIFFSRIVTTGFSNLIHSDDGSPDITDKTASLAEALRRTSVSGEMCPRIAVSPTLLIDMLSCIYYIM